MRALFSCIPSEGHFRPLLPLARALAAAGHDIAFATAVDWHPRVAAEGFEALPAGRSRAELADGLAAVRRATLELPPDERRPLAFSGNFALVHAPPKLPELLRVAAAWRADTVVYDSADLAAPLAAAVLGVPSVHHSFGAMIPLAALERAAEAGAPLWRAHRVEPDPHAGAFRGLYVDILPSSLAREQPLGERVAMRPVGTAEEAAPAALDDLPAPRIYVTLGTIFNDAALLRTLLAALDGEASALVTTGRDVDPVELGPAPARVRIERFVDQAGVLPHCAAVVCHGGSGTTLGALAHGVPLVLVPQGADQFDNAARCAAAGTAVVVRPDELTPAAVGSALRRVLDDPAFTSAAQRLAREIAEMGTPEEVARLVEAYVARG
ncbi:MAG: jadS [Gaiellaceae bacterium]|nr:jadS [Gaiellaceae bacterium]